MAPSARERGRGGPASRDISERRCRRYLNVGATSGGCSRAQVTAQRLVPIDLPTADLARMRHCLSHKEHLIKETRGHEVSLKPRRNP